MSGFAKVCVAVGLLTIAAGCASIQLTNAWRDPAFSGGPFKSIMVIGVTKQAAVRRIFEDEFAQRLSEHGVKAVPSYTLIPEDGEVPKDRLAEAVRAAGVQGVLITRWVKVQQRTQVYPGSYWGPPYMGFYGYYDWVWGGFYEPPQVVSYDVVTTETSLFDAATNTLVWSGTTESFSPRDLRKDTREFADVMIKALAANGLI